MMKRSGTRSLEEFGFSSSKGVGEIESVVDLNPVSHSVSPAGAAAAPSPSHGATSDVETIDTPSRSEV